MPGVPSSRGCDACRKVKKKCDQLKPTCSRCARLKITCVGSGQQRFMFKNQSIKVSQPQDAGTLQQTTVTCQRKLSNPLGNPAQVLNTTTGSLAASFVATLQVTDVRYGVSYYGSFFRDIPQRLGNSVVLDSAVKAISSAYPFLITGSVPRDALVHYGQSLRALRNCLNNPSEARAAHTLCAVYLITVCQSWLGKSDDSITGHSEAISFLLKAAALHEWKGTFEMEMVITLCAPIILESIVNPRIKMDSQFWEIISSYRRRLNPRGYEQSQSSAQMHHIAMIPEFVQNPDAHLSEIARIYLILKNDSLTLKPVLDECAKFVLVSFSSPDVARHCKVQSAYTIVCTLAVLLNSLLRVFDPLNTNLTEETAHFCNEIIIQTELASCYRPVGSSYSPLCLIVAWATTDDIFQLAKIESLIAVYQSDFAEVPWMSQAICLGLILNSHRVRTASGKLLNSPEDSKNGEEALVGAESCCIL